MFFEALKRFQSLKSLLKSLKSFEGVEHARTR